jgi:hypothetical protein
MSVGFLRMLVALFTVLVGRGGVLLGLVMLAVSVVVRRLQMVVGGGMVPRRRQMVVFHRRVLVMFGHWINLLSNY